MVIRAPNSDHIFQTDNLKRTYNDNLERVRWRSKQNLDYAWLINFCVNLSTYYLQLEDDVLAAPNYIQHLRDFVKDNANKEWVMLELSPHGFIGKLFKTFDLPKLVSVLRVFYLEQPCDFLVVFFRNLLLQTKSIKRKESLFFHEGKFSSLENVVRGVDKLPVNVAAKRLKGHNPPANLYTTMKTYKNYLLSYAYAPSANQFFWTYDIKAGDALTIVFAMAQRVEKIVIETGFSEEVRTLKCFEMSTSSKSYHPPPFCFRSL